MYATDLASLGEAWLRSAGAFTPDPEPPSIFAVELEAFTEHMRVERGLTPTTIRARDESLRWFFASLPRDIPTLGEVTASQIDHFLAGQVCRSWTVVHYTRWRAACTASFDTRHTKAGVPSIWNAALSCLPFMHLRMSLSTDRARGKAGS
jgi:hypothetical protein